MITLKIAWRDIVRQRSRTWLTIAAIAFCSASILLTMSFSRGSHQQMIQSGVSAFTGHFQIQHQGYQDDPSLYKSFEISDDILDKIESGEHVTGAAPRIITQGLASADEGTAGIFIVGADPAREARSTTLVKKVSEGEFLKAGDNKGVVIGQTLAANLKVGVGDEIQVMIQSFYGSLQLRTYRVSGLMKTGSGEFDQGMFLMPLEELRDLMEMPGLATEVAIALDSPRSRRAAMASVRSTLDQSEAAELVLMPWEKVTPELYEFVMLDNAGGVLYLSILVIVVAFVVLLTVTMSVLERMREFGVLLAIGTRPRRVFSIVMTESVLMGLIGTVLGMIFASILCYYWSIYPIEFTSMQEAFAEFGMEPIIKTILLPIMYVATTAILMTITTLVALFPAFKASRIKPVDALRYV